MDIKEQYKTPDNLKSRIGLYRFSTSPQTFYQWIGSLIPRQKSIGILELGCGTGLIWQSLMENFPDSRIILSDLSENMLAEAERNLAEAPVKFRKIDYHSIPYDDDSFDLVLSNHNLYHAENLDTVLSEIKRVLHGRGTFICSTNSSRHLEELKKILAARGIESLWPNGSLTDKFGMENGAELLSPYFSSVNKYTFGHKLHITDPAAIINYFESVRNDELRNILKRERKSIIEEINRHIETRLYYEVHSEPGIFICHI